MDYESEWAELNPKLLIVDDDPLIIQSLSQILRGIGSIFFATRGQDALLTLNEQDIDLVILDMHMPQMDGLEVCRIIKNNPRHEDLPVIFVTATTDLQAEERALHLGAVDFIGKPVRPAVVRARIKTHLALRQKTLALKKLASIDMLTRIPNRRAFNEALEMEWRRAQRMAAPLSLLMMDIDYFKKFNDHYGHMDGDKCLTAVGYALKTTIRRAGDFVARYGGEEFSVLLPQTERANALKFAQHIHKALKEMEIPHLMNQVSQHVTLSIGISSFEPTSGETVDYVCKVCQAESLAHGPECLLQSADRALYQAKADGRNRTRYYPMELIALDSPAITHSHSAEVITVLLADDNVINRKLVEKVLSNQAIQVLQATNGLEAIQTLTESTRHVHLILMDLQMPIMDGMEATKQIRALAHYRKIPILALTAQHQEDIAKLFEVGFNDWIQKPFKVDQLIAIIRKWTGQSVQKETNIEPEQTGPFPEVAGIHMADAKVLAAGDPRFFSQILGQFINDAHQTLADIKEDLARKDHRSAQALLHRLRGSSGSVAAHDLVQYTLTFENKLANPDFDPDPWIRHLGEEIQRIEHSAHDWVPQVSSKIDWTPDQWQEVLMALKNREIAILGELLNALAPLRDHFEPAEYSRINAALTSLNFELAYQLLQSLEFLQRKKPKRAKPNPKPNVS